MKLQTALIFLGLGILTMFSPSDGVAFLGGLLTVSMLAIFFLSWFFQSDFTIQFTKKKD